MSPKIIAIFLFLSSIFGIASNAIGMQSSGDKKSNKGLFTFALLFSIIGLMVAFFGLKGSSAPTVAAAPLPVAR